VGSSEQHPEECIREEMRAVGVKRILYSIAAAIAERRPGYWEPQDCDREGCPVRVLALLGVDGSVTDYALFPDADCPLRFQPAGPS
jgi:hypothetical protein